MIIRGIDLNSEAWRNLVFEGKNRKYGAYYLRKTSSRRHLRALLIVVVFCLLLFPVPMVVSFYQSQKTEKIVFTPVELSNLVMLNDIPDINTVRPEKEIPEKIETSTPPVVVNNDERIEDVKKELAELNLAGDSTAVVEGMETDSFVQQKLAELEKAKNHTSEISDQGIQNPEYPGGQTELLRYIYGNITYPSAASKQRIQGQVVCSFIINENGSVSDIRLEKRMYIFLDDEVLRVLHSLPTWKPAMKEGKAIKVKYYLPVTFKIPSQ